MMRRMKRTLGFAIPVLLAAALPALAGTVTFSFNQHSTQNLFQMSDAVADQVSAFTLSIDQDSEALSFLANVSYSAFHQTTGLSFLAADAGFDYLVLSGEKSAFYFAALGTGFFFGRDYAAFSSLGAHLVGAYKTYLAPSSILKLQWQGWYAAYNDSLFDNASMIASMSLDKYFQSRTTLKADAQYGYKYFLHPFLTDPMTEPILAPVTSGTTTVTSASPWGGNPYDSDRGFIPRFRAGGGGAGIGHVAVSFLAAQGIGEYIGLSASAARQWIVSGENPFLSIEEFYLVQNPSADAFSWDGLLLTGRITLILPWSIEAKTGYTHSDKTYPGVELLDLEGLPTGVMRNDVRHLFEARLQKSFRRFSIFAAYSHIDNTSNDPLFDWSAHAIMAGFEWALGSGSGGAP
jgi:hypothetical protein